VNAEIEDIGQFFGDAFDFIDTYESLPAINDAIESIGLRNFFEYDVRGSVVADIGCGYGRSILEMLGAGAERAIAVDVSEKQLLRAKAVIERAGFAGKVSYIKTSADDLELPDASCDVVVSLGVIHHLPSFEKGLDELCRITRPSGTLFLATLGKKGLIPRIRRFLRFGTRLVPYPHVRALLENLPISRTQKYIVADTLWSKYYHQHSVGELERFLAERGFEVVRIADIYAAKSPFYRFLQGEGYVHLMARKAAA